MFHRVRNLMVQAFAHIMLALICALVFIHGIDGPLHNSWLHWFFFGFTWVNVWIASKRWTVAYEMVD